MFNKRKEKYSDIVNGLNGEDQNTEACSTLKRNIDFEGSETNQWIPIGVDLWDNYEGTFDGRNHSISGLYIHISSSEGFPEYSPAFGLFGYLGANSTIKNLIVNGEIIIENLGDENSCLVVGQCSGSPREGSTNLIKYCYNTGNITVNGT